MAAFTSGQWVNMGITDEKNTDDFAFNASLWYQNVAGGQVVEIHFKEDYRKISNIRRTNSPKLNVSRLIVQLPLPNPMKPVC